MALTDTDPEADRVLTELLRKAPVWRKMEMLAELNRTANQLALEGLRKRFPNATEAVLKRHLADLLLGAELAEKAYGPNQLPASRQEQNVTEPVFVILFVIDVLDRLGIPYFIGGSFASVAYGHVRTTQDVDIVAYLEPSHIDAFLVAVELDFYVDKLMIQDAISRRSSFNLIHLNTAFKVDIFLPKNRAFDQQQLAPRETGYR